MRGHDILCASRGETKQKIRHYCEFSTLVWLKSVKSDYTSLQWCVHRDTHPLSQRQETFWSKVHSRQPQETNTIAGALKCLSEIVRGAFLHCISQYSCI